jgi:phosphate:Na+ symporter
VLEKIANRVLPDTEEEKQELLDPRLMATPSVAIAGCDSLAETMAGVAKDTLTMAMAQLKAYDPKNEAQILQWENTLDRYEDKLGTYLVKLSTKRLSEADSLRVSKILHSIGDFERLGDHALNLSDSAKELHEKKLSFSPKAQKELPVLFAAMEEILGTAHRAYVENDAALAAQIEPLEEVIDELVASIKTRHVARLQAGQCSIEMGFILSDILNNMERISDHCSNLAVTIIELSHKSFHTHKYLKGVRSNSAQFHDSYAMYVEKYSLPNA